MQAITSRQNAWFKRVRDAVRTHDLEIAIEGEKQVRGALDAGWTAIAIVTRAGEVALTPTDALVDQIEFAPVLFDALGDTRTSQGIIGLFRRPSARAEEILARRDTVAVALDAVQDPGNVGTIVRLAAAFDASGVLLLPGCADPFGPKAVRASSGAILEVPIANISAEELLEAALPLVTTDGRGEAADPPSRNAILVFGSEGSGVSPVLLEQSKRLAIPMTSRVESINVATAAAILLSRSFVLRSATR